MTEFPSAITNGSGAPPRSIELVDLVQRLTLLVLYPEHSTTRPSALSAASNGVSPAKTQRLQSKLIPNLAFLAPWREEIRSQSSNNKCVHLRGTTLVLFQFHRGQQRNHANRQRKHKSNIHRSDKDLRIPRIGRRPWNP